MITEGGSLSEGHLRKMEWIDIEPFHNYRLQLNCCRFLAKMSFWEKERNVIIRFVSFERISDERFERSLKRKILKQNISAK